MRKLLFPFILIGFTLLMAAGCSDDDDCPTCPCSEQLNYIVSGSSFLYEGEFHTDLLIYSADGWSPDVDSILVAGKNVPRRSEIEVRDYQETEFTSGDTLEINVFTPDGVGTCLVKLLDSAVDRPVFLTLPPDSFAVESEILVEWSSVPQADWYELSTIYIYDSAGTRSYHIDECFLHDTSYTISGSECQYDGRMDIFLFAMTGPMPDEPGNVSGEGFAGVISGWASAHTMIYIGTGDPFPDPSIVGATQPSGPTLPDELMNPQTEWLK